MASTRRVDEVLQQGSSADLSNTVAMPDNPANNDHTAWYVWASKAVAIIFGLGTGIVGAAALLSIGQPLWIALSLGTFSFISNFLMTNENVTTVMLGGIDALFREKDTEGSEYLSLRKQRLVKLGIFLTLTFGMTMGALTYVAALKLATLALFAPLAPALPAIGAVLAVVTLITQCSLMTKGWTDIIRIDDLWGKTKAWVKDNFDITKKDAAKSDLRFVIERVLMAVIASTMLIPVILLICWGKTESLGSCVTGLSDIIQKIPAISPVVVDWASFIIAQVLAFAAQIPFVLKVTVIPTLGTVDVLNKFFSLGKSGDQEPANTSNLQKAIMIMKTAGTIISSFFNSACMAAIAMQGKANNLATTFGGIGAFFDGFVSNIVNAYISGDKKTENKFVEEAAESPEQYTTGMPSSTAQTYNGLGVIPSPANDRLLPADKTSEDERAVFTNQSPTHDRSLSSAQSIASGAETTSQTRKVM